LKENKGKVIENPRSREVEAVPHHQESLRTSVTLEERAPVDLIDAMTMTIIKGKGDLAQEKEETIEMIITRGSQGGLMRTNIHQE